ncbi:MAG: hypothetical protein NUV53_01410, partial [Patescibacteria group bacterium]|nr:hypothetical protein [Patescibacteria group bacterium]
MPEESRQCQNCKQSFQIDTQDFAFYEKISVPPPTFCPECRLKRRLMWRNERSLYKRTCGLCGDALLSVYHSQSPYTVYCAPCWWSDTWDPLSSGKEYDFTKPFFTQYEELFKNVPRIALEGKNSLNCDYANYLENVRNVYLSYSVIFGSEDVWYSKNIDHSRWVMDSFDVSESEQCYQCIAISKSYNCRYAQFSHDCIDCAYVFDCINCQNCILCTNQRNKRYCVRNKQVTKEEYEKEMIRIKNAGRDVHVVYERNFEDMKVASIRKYAWTKNVVASTGDDIRDSKNLIKGFSCYGMENAKFIFRCVSLKDSMDATNGGRSELYYEFIGGGGVGSNRVRFCSYNINGLSDVEYTDHCGSSSNLFGCVGVRSKQYCILNKQYSKESFDELKTRIIEHMDVMPYVDNAGRIYR